MNRQEIEHRLMKEFLIQNSLQEKFDEFVRELAGDLSNPLDLEELERVMMLVFDEYPDQSITKTWSDDTKLDVEAWCVELHMGGDPGPRPEVLKDARFD